MLPVNIWPAKLLDQNTLGVDTINSNENIPTVADHRDKRKASADELRKPNLFIAGAAKSGTTTLWNYFKNHPQVYVPESRIDKEPGYFSDLANIGKLSLKSYLKLFKNAKAKHKYVGEASHAYLTDPASARRLHKFNPRSKIIIILRNPADRAYSLYNWMRQEGYEWAGSFERALKLENWRKEKELSDPLHPSYYYNYMYFHSGLYSKQVERFINLFGREQVLVLGFFELKSEPEKTLKKICDFLDVDPILELPAIVNPSKKAYSAKLQYILRMSVTARSVFKKHVLKKRDTNKAKRDRLLKLGIVNKKPDPMNQATRKRLKARYKSDIERLEKLTKKDFSRWLR